MSVLTLRAGRPLVRIPESVTTLFAALAAALAASREFQRLQALSDRQLAERGLVREDLPRLIFDHHLR